MDESMTHREQVRDFDAMLDKHFGDPDRIAADVSMEQSPSSSFDAFRSGAAERRARARKRSVEQAPPVS